MHMFDQHFFFFALIYSSLNDKWNHSFRIRRQINKIETFKSTVKSVDMYFTEHVNNLEYMWNDRIHKF